ncbi:flagellar protein FliS [Acidithiobacillus caldus ATCC 51756]|nr:flagellar protein FliS [Acidithiobacillus caldus]MBU2734206.1 flagellar protein FliS [Acidithiobacillus caldus ATCC 51756]MBU2746053.1 flagellar protein FliS [Acidithiobacillus caldus]MBU2779941.1 flagellar protein FliS [Acidithiobacillus caldus]OFC38965.1 hypothetical protein BAE29_08190 [Acidithiobacillus caldus]
MAANPYALVRNETATPLDLWDRGYRRCVALLQGAKHLMSSRDPADLMEKARLLHDAFAIVEFWLAALPPDDAESTASTNPSFQARLRTAYTFVLHRIVKANLNNKPEDLEEALKMLQHLRQVFRKEEGVGE